MEVQPEVEAFIGKVVDEGARDLGEGRSGRHTVVVVDDAVAVLVVILHVARPDTALPERLAAGLSQDLLLALVDTLGTDQVERRHRLTHLQDVARPYFDEVIRAVSLLRERHDLVMLITEREAHIPRQATATQRMSGDHGLETLVTDPPHVGGRPRVTAQGVDGVREQQVARILVIPVERQLQASIEERSVDTQVVLQRFLPRQVRVRTRVGESQPRLPDVSHIAGAIGVEVVVIADPLLVARIADGDAEL